ncbi:hypothetical protein FB45DRAFT_877879 [Roridomyces roridus]|uniref:Uncharacterized protein n=1 Tax=Roridomyces roridus TaxID=1738132 RepID=A0AAD7B1G8_9AGAR|nr:hypothetical protein FB45DRAFT_877879 [Roridomyces roridus]
MPPKGFQSILSALEPKIGVFRRNSELTKGSEMGFGQSPLQRAKGSEPPGSRFKALWANTAASGSLSRLCALRGKECSTWVPGYSAVRRCFGRSVVSDDDDDSISLREGGRQRAPWLRQQLDLGRPRPLPDSFVFATSISWIDAPDCGENDEHRGSTEKGIAMPVDRAGLWAAGVQLELNLIPVFLPPCSYTYTLPPGLKVENHVSGILIMFN